MGFLNAEFYFQDQHVASYCIETVLDQLSGQNINNKLYLLISIKVVSELVVSNAASASLIVRSFKWPFICWPLSANSGSKVKRIYYFFMLTCVTMCYNEYYHHGFDAGMIMLIIVQQ